MAFVPSVVSRDFLCACGAHLFLGIVANQTSLHVDPLENQAWNVDDENPNFVFLTCGECQRKYKVSKVLAVIQEIEE